MDHNRKVIIDIFKTKQALFERINLEYSQIIDSYKKKFEISYKLLNNSIKVRGNQVESSELITF